MTAPRIACDCTATSRDAATGQRFSEGHRGGPILAPRGRSAGVGIQECAARDTGTRTPGRAAMSLQRLAVASGPLFRQGLCGAGPQAFRPDDPGPLGHFGRVGRIREKPDRWPAPLAFRANGADVCQIFGFNCDVVAGGKFPPATCVERSGNQELYSGISFN